MTVVIFGGTGFIGSHFSKYLLDNQLVSQLYLVDIEPLEIKSSLYRRVSLINHSEIRYEYFNVQNDLNDFSPQGLIVEMAFLKE